MTMSAIPYVSRYVRGSMWQTLKPAATGTFNSRRNVQMPHTANRTPNYQRFSTIVSSAHTEPRTQSLKYKSQPLMSRKSYPQPLRIQQKCNRAWQSGTRHSLSPDKEILFSARLSKIWEGLMKFPMTPEWERIISLQRDNWLTQIQEYTPVRIKSMLASPKAPTLAQLESLGSLGWINISNRGVYLYISENCIITLFEIPFKSRTEEEIMQIRALVTLAKEVFMIWLGAVDEVLYPAIKDLVPWELESIEYLGLTRDLPFATDLKGSKKS